MTDLTDRGKAFENKYARDEETRFKVRARRNRLFSEWIADQLGKKGPDKEAYVMAVVKSDLEEPGDADLLRKVKEDIVTAGLELSDHTLQTRLMAFLDRAVEDITGD